MAGFVIRVVSIHIRTRALRRCRTEGKPRTQVPYLALRTERCENRSVEFILELVHTLAMFGDKLSRYVICL